MLGIRSASDLALHPLRGAIFENFVVNELQKLFYHQGERPPLFFWRHPNGKEIDAILDLGVKRVAIEIKSGESFRSDFFKNLADYRDLCPDAQSVLVYAGEKALTFQDHRVLPWWMIT